MSFYVFTTPEDIHFRHADDPRSVTIVDDAMQPRSAAFLPATDDYDSAISLVANRFALGYWSGADLQLSDLKSGEPLAAFPFRKIGPLAAFDRAGRRLLFKSGSQVVLLDVETGEATQLKGVRALDRLVRLADSDEVLVASQKKGELLHISLVTGRVRAVPLAIDATLFDVKQSPAAGQLILIDRKKGVHCVDASDWSLAWSVSLKKVLGKDHLGVGQYCGDGSLFGGAVSGSNETYTIVLDAHTGAQVNRIDGTQYGLPYRGTKVRSQATRRDSYLVDTLDLASGEEGTIALDEQDA